MATTLLNVQPKRITHQQEELFTQFSLDIAQRVQTILAVQGKTQKELAQAMGKTESEISKWLSGTHNLTLKSIAKLQTVLKAPIISVSAPARPDDMHSLKDPFYGLE